MSMSVTNRNTPSTTTPTSGKGAAEPTANKVSAPATRASGSGDGVDAGEAIAVGSPSLPGTHPASGAGIEGVSRGSGGVNTRRGTSDGASRSGTGGETFRPRSLGQAGSAAESHGKITGSPRPTSTGAGQASTVSGE